MTASGIRAAAIVLAAAWLTGSFDSRPECGRAACGPTAQNPSARAERRGAGTAEPANTAPPPAVDRQAFPPGAVLTAAFEARGASRPGAAQDAFAPAEAGHRAWTGRPLIGSSLLVPLIWRLREDHAQWIDVARHHRLRPEIKAARSRRRHARHHHKEAAAESAPPQTVVVKKGDTINSIARRLHTSPKAIMEANPDRRPRDLKLGEELNLPGSEPESAPAPERRRRGREAEAGRKAQAAESNTYTVRRGDTLYSIARRSDVTIDELKRLNRLRSSSRLHVGQSLNLPGAPEEEAAAPRAARPKTPRRRHLPQERPVPTPGFEPEEPASAAHQPPAASMAPSQPIPYGALPGAHASPPPAYAPQAPAYAPPPAAPETAPSAPAAENPVGPTDAQVAAAGRGRFAWPTTGSLLSGFGPKPGGQRNDGVDIAAPDGAPVRAAAAGDVVYAGNLVPGFGNLVLLKHEDGWVTAYAHLARTEVKIKDHVAQGAEIGTVGSSGGVDQPQLHFEVRYAPSPRERARPIDPALVLPAQ